MIRRVFATAIIALLLIGAFLALIEHTRYASIAEAQTHTFCALDVSCIWTAAQTFSGSTVFTCGPQAGTGPSVAYANCATGADIWAQVNAAEAALPANGGTIYVLPGSYDVTTQLVINKTIALSGLGPGFEQNAGQHAPVRVRLTSGAGPMVLCSGVGGIGSKVDGFELNNTSTTLIGFIDFENSCSAIVGSIYIDRPTVKALSYGLKVGDPVGGAVNYFQFNNSQIAHAAPTGVWLANVQANAYFYASWFSQNGYVGTVNTSNGALGLCAANCFQLATGANYPSDISWNGLPVIIGTTRFVISVMNSATSGTLTSAPGTQTGVAFAFASQGTFGSTSSPSNIFTSVDGYWKPTKDFGGELLEDALPVTQFVNLTGAHTFVGDTWEVGANSSITGFAMETAVAGTMLGGISCYGCTLNAVIGTNVSAYVHANTTTANIALYGTSLGENVGVPSNPIAIFQNDASSSIKADGTVAHLSEVVNLATGTLGTTTGTFISNTNGNDLLNLFGTTTSFGAPNANIVASTGDLSCARKTGGDLCKFFFGTGNHFLDFGVSSAGAWTFSAGTVRIPSQLSLGTAGGTSGQVALNGSTSGQATIVGPAVAGITTNPVTMSNTLQTPLFTSAGGATCTNGELALSAGWQSTGSATVTSVNGISQTCSWTITTGTTTAANPTITDTLVTAFPTATVACEMNIHGGTHTAAAGEGFQQTTLSATAPIFTFQGTPTAGGTTYFITRRCGP